jgi:MFS transporter, PHS family, inorganic phosphate transporter
MLAAVFLMQPIGQFLAYIVGYGALRGITKDRLPNWTTADWDDPAKSETGAATIVSDQ